MKKIILLVLSVLPFISLNIVNAQPPQAMNYQAVARNASGTILVNQHISLRMTVTDGNGGSTLFQETDTTTTNQFGLFSLKIGEGVPIVNTFSSIPWATVTPWLSVELDPAGGSSYQFMGSSQLLSVPYALFAASGNQGPAGLDGDRYTSVSTTSMTINTGNQSFFIDTGLSYSIGQTIIIANSVSNQMTASVASYNPANGAMVATVTSVSGSGTYSSWNVSLNGAPGPAGPPGLLPNGNAAGNTPYWNGSSWVVNSSSIFNNGGNIGVNTNVPAGKVHIKGSADAAQLVIDANTTQSNTQPLIRLRNSSGVDLMHIHSDHATNTFVGLHAGKLNTGTYNSFFGSDAGASNTTGSDNTASGWGALFSNQTGSDNVAIGYQTLNANTTGSNNVASGAFALSSNTGGNDNVANGVFALSQNTFGYSNTSIGSNSLYFNTVGNLNTAVGFQALNNNTASENTALGSDALLQNTTGYNNTASGRTALKSNSSGFNNTAHGYASLFSNTSGRYNTAAGRNALYSNQNGSYNTAMGNNALYSNLVGFENSAFGDSALFSNNTGFQNVAIGKSSLQSNTTGYANTAAGMYALKNNSTGYLNVAIGDSSLISNIDGDFNSGIGFLSNVSSGSFLNATAIGSRAIVDASDKVRIGDPTVTVIEGQVNFSIPSDGRFKYNVTEKDIKGLAFIKLLRPVEYNFNTRQYEEFLTKNMPEAMRKRYLEANFEASSAIRQSGFIAQDVENAMKQSGYNFNGLHKPDGENDHYSVSYSLFVVPLVKAVQEQQSQIEELTKQNEKLQNENKSFKEDIQKIKAQLGIDLKR